MTKYYIYGMRLRGFAPACQPMSGLYKVLDDIKGIGDKKYHNLLIYKRKLDPEEQEKYELDELKVIFNNKDTSVQRKKNLW